MLAIPGYNLGRSLSESRRTVTYRAVRDDGLPVVLKLPVDESPGLEQITRFEQEDRLLERVSSPGVVGCHGLLWLETRPALVVEDFGGASLSSQQLFGELELPMLISIAIRVAQALGAIHAKGVVHKDVNPSNIVWNRATDHLALIDFDIAGEVIAGTNTILSDGGLEGTLPYIAPEQTGRINRSIDSRADLYSLGATLYELLAGRPPFESDDAMELVHAHIARPPQPLPNEVPPPLSQMVLKLLHKRPEDRYQTAAGLRADLAECLRQLETTGDVSVFELGRTDAATIFRVPDDLYGREAELGQLRAAFEELRSTGSCGLTLVTGGGGTGKSSLIRELYVPVVSAGGRFVRGKFNEADQNMPYASFVRAFGELVRLLLASNAERLSFWSERIQSALGRTGAVVLDLLPELELIVGEQPPVPDLPANESQNRFNYTLARFVKAVASAEYPLVLFLDDLQWADQGSLQLIELIMTDPDVQHVLLVASYRDEQVGQWHPLATMVDRLRKAGSPVRSVSLGPLDVAAISGLLRATLGEDSEGLEDLARACLDKTDGNPFFLSQFLRTLHESRAVVYSAGCRGWTWDVEQIQALDVTDNVVDLMTARIDTLSAAGRRALKVAACIGKDFDAAMLTGVLGGAAEEALSGIREASRQGLVLGVRRFAVLSGTGALDSQSSHRSASPTSYRFAHDRIREAALSRVEDRERQALHLAVGRALLRDLDASSSSRLFETTNQLNLGAALVDDPEERLRVAQVNLRAARRARRAMAHRTALEYVQAGIALLPDDAWASHYELTVALHRAGAEAAQLAADLERMTSHGEQITCHGKTLVERLAVYEIKISYHQAMREPVQAVDACLEALRLLGIRLPRHPGLWQILFGFFWLRRLMRDPADIEALPEMTDPEMAAAMRLIRAASVAAYLTETKLIPLLTFKMVELTIRHGVHPFSMWGIAGYGFILSGPFGKVTEGFAYADTSLRMLARVDAPEAHTSAEFMYWMFVAPWKEPFSNAIKPMQRAVSRALDSGDAEGAAMCQHLLLTQFLWSGAPLATVDEHAAVTIRLLERFTQEWFRKVDSQLWYAVCRLSGATGRFDEVVGNNFDQQEHFGAAAQRQDHGALALGHTLALFAAYLGGDLDAAVEHAAAARRDVEAMASCPYEAQFVFYEALALLAAARANGSLAARARRTIRRDLKRLARWSETAPEYFRCKQRLVQAELARAAGDSGAALSTYRSALRGFREHRLLPEAGICAELLAGYLAELGLDGAALVYARQSHQAFARWGAPGCVARLEERFPGLAADAPAPREGGTSRRSRKTTSGTGRAGDELDLGSLLKTSRAISGELILDRLIDKMMRIVVENAGAQRGLLLLEQAGQWSLAAEHAVDREQVDRPTDTWLEQINCQQPRAAVDVVNFSINSGQQVVLDDASQEGDFTGDPYVLARAPRSILCFPIRHRGDVAGIIYLENNAIAGAFTEDRVEVLDVLCSQIAVSMQNALLFRDKEELISAYQRFVPQEFLGFLGKQSIVQVELGDQVEREMTVLFTDIRNFTGMSERMTPKENFAFINSFLSAMEPVIREHGGFIDKYIGDAIMALFPSSADDAVRGAVRMVQRLASDNGERQARGEAAVRIGVGLNSGRLMLGTVGGANRMDGTVISDAVNLASRIEGMTKLFGATILISEHTFARLTSPADLPHREIGRVTVKGKAEPVTVYEVLDGDPAPVAALKAETRDDFGLALRAFGDSDLPAARALFEAVLRVNPADGAAAEYLRRCVPAAGASAPDRGS